MRNDIDKLEKVNGIYMRMSFMADTYMKITEYLHVIISNMPEGIKKNHGR
jgi:hypothetical protein